MCWISRKLNKQVATKDITVYKVVIINNRDCASLFYKFKYKYNRVYTESFTIEEFSSEFHITTGFHSYKSLEAAQLILAFIRMNRRECNGRIIRCIIPKGAIYYINNYKEVVSNKIIIDSCYE